MFKKSLIFEAVGYDNNYNDHEIEQILKFYESPIRKKMNEIDLAVGEIICDIMRDILNKLMRLKMQCQVK